MLSAFAARKAAQQTQEPLEIPFSSASPAYSSSSAEVEIPPTPPPSRKRKQETERDKTPCKRPKRAKEKMKDHKLRYYEPQEDADALHDSVPSALEDATREYSPSQLVAGVFGAGEADTPVNSSAVVDVVPVLSTFEPSNGLNLFVLSVEEHRQLEALGLPNKRSTAIVLQAGETLSFLGTVGLTLLQGVVTLFGTTLHPSTTQHPIFAPRSYPVATITAGDDSSNHPLLSEATWLPKHLGNNVTRHRAILLLQDLDCGIEGLGQVCKTFANVFQIDSDYRGVDFGLTQFRPIRQGSLNLPPFETPLSWNTTITELCNAYGSGCGVAPMVLVEGGRNVGKSTFCRTLLNNLLNRYEKVAYLECDLGQSEFTPGGMVSLHVLSHPVFGPPFSHPSEPLRAHFVGSTSAKSSPDFYLECISALVETYRLDVQRSQDHLDSEEDTEGPQGRIANTVPLIINTAGWIKGMGRELLQRIEDEVQPTHLVEFENPDIDQAWSESVPPRPSNLIQLVIERAPGISAPTRYSAADHRAVCMLSYFHSREIAVPLSDITSECEPQGQREWITDLPLCAQLPWEVNWLEGLDHVVLIGSGAEDVVPSEVLRVLNGAIVGLVALDPHAIPWIEQPPDTTHSKSIPYVQGSSPPLPNSSNCVGLALIRSIRPSSRVLHILTPIPPSHLAMVRVLVMGEIQLPIWGMLDYRVAEEAAGTLTGVDYDKVPFLCWASGGAVAIHGSRKKRVRRNLMRKSQL